MFLFTIGTFLYSFFSVFIISFSLFFIRKSFISNRNLSKLDIILTYKFRISSFIRVMFDYFLFIRLTNVVLRCIFFNFQNLVVFGCIDIAYSLLFYILSTFILLLFFYICFYSKRKVTKEK